MQRDIQPSLVWETSNARRDEEGGEARQKLRIIDLSVRFMIKCDLRPGRKTPVLAASSSELNPKRQDQLVTTSTRNRAGRIVSVALCASGLLVACAFGPVPAAAETINQALSDAYRYSPKLDAERARQRGTDEEVTRARSGWRPKAELNADLTYQYSQTKPNTSTEGETVAKGYSVDATQPIFNGFQTLYGVRGAEADVRAGREQLRSVEQEVLLDAAIAYADVVRDAAIVQAREDNVNVLTKELAATRDRFAVGEVTKTDVAQAEARRASAISLLDLARANLHSSHARYERVIGHPPGSLAEPHGYEQHLPKSVQEAINLAVSEHPQVVATLYQEESARHAVDRIRGELLPSVDLDATYQDRFDTNPLLDEQEVSTVSGRLRVPIYEGGEVYARVRQAKQVHIQRLQLIQQARAEVQAEAVSAWSQYLGARSQVESDVVAVQANKTALEGVKAEELVGQRSVIEVLDAQLDLINSQVQLVSNRRGVVVAAYTLLSAVGRLDVADLGVSDPVYDPEVHYQEVRRKWFGLSITDAEGHVEVVPPPSAAPVK